MVGYLEWAVSLVAALGMVLPNPDGTRKPRRAPARPNLHIQTYSLENSERELATTREALKVFEQQNDPMLHVVIDFYKKDEARLLREIENLRHGTVPPIDMPVVLRVKP